MVQSSIRRRWCSIRQFLFHVGLFIRFPSLGTSAIMALFGAVSVSAPLAARRLPGIILGAIAFS